MIRILKIALVLLLVSCEGKSGMEYDLSKISCSEEWYEISGWSAESKDYGKLKELADVRRRLFDESLEGLSKEERQAIENGEDPFSSAEKYEEAVSYSKKFVTSLKGIEYVDDVTIDYYHGDALVITVHTKKPVSWRVYRKDIPEVWKGVPVFVLQSRKNA